MRLWHRILSLLMLFSCSACEVDYDFNGKAGKPQVVVNALISPQEPFSLQLNWSKPYSAEGKFTPVAEAGFKLYENGASVAHGTSGKDGSATTSFVATAGRRYRLEVIVPDYGELSAETLVPEEPIVAIDFVWQKGWYRHFALKTLTISSGAKALWIRGTHKERNSYTGKDRIEQIGSYYTTSTFVDQVNGANDTHEADEKGSTVNFEHFLRIPGENSQLVVPLHFSVYGAPEDLHTFQFITASDSYDRYARSRYKQYLNSEWGAEGNPFIEQITVYSNISNGLGIFAGYNYMQTPEL